MQHSDAEKEKATGSFGYKDLTLYKFMFKYTQKYKGLLGGIIWQMILYTIFTAISPLLIKIAMDKFTDQAATFFDIQWLDAIVIQFIDWLVGIFPQVERIWLEVGLVAFLYLLFQAIIFYSSYRRTILMSNMGLQASRDMAQDTFSHLQELDLSYHDRNEVGRIMSRLTSDIMAIREFLGGRVVTNLSNIVTVFVILGFLFSLDLFMALVSVVVIPLILSIGVVGRKSIRARRKENRRLNAQMMANIGESIAGIRVIKTLNRESQNNRNFEKINLANTHATIRSNIIHAVLFPTLLLGSSLGTAFLVLIGGYRYFAGAITIGVLLAFLNYNAILFRPIVILGNLYQELQDALTGAERIKSLLDTETKVPWNLHLPDLPPIEGAIAFDNITFEYYDNVPIYDPINLNISAGMTIALVGKTGAGKTTIINILSRLYKLKKGRLLVDDQEISDFSLPSFRKQITSVPQDFFVFSGSVRDNLHLGDPKATDKDMWFVLEQVGLKDSIERFEYGLDTPLQERGKRLSVGQRQLLVFAMALLADPRIIVLDEATSSVDVFSEIKIQKAIKLLLSNRTAFIIAHRLSTIRDADMIAVIDDGNIVEMGTHEELLKKQGAYYTLVRNQIELTEFISN
ncbi:Vitamin B12 import ATP-binding protein BtuD [Candidatus Lokiarchaeum ossiferum]|uniref:Vitamin B12 import ATP-binding protein BtuD n=1 Tax=Candidatus Lokiarchaeum ossiferum TaxID=2951803 RepID=A0ABY6HRT7_9ARCH|nr:Vitamin B12 import ATP-binding protein BtuD [Candidatus Lokiarchaeum sp. B-35]